MMDALCCGRPRRAGLRIYIFDLDTGNVSVQALPGHVDLDGGVPESCFGVLLLSVFRAMVPAYGYRMCPRMFYGPTAS